MANMLYNGVELPDINTVWTDKTTYPYAYIIKQVNPSVSFSFVVCDAAAYFTNSNHTQITIFGNLISYILSDGSWVFSESGKKAFGFSLSHTTATYRYDFIWASTDILYTDGSVYLAASDPVNPHITESSGDGYALYNGVKLPNIDSVWTDKETYPYAYIGSNYSDGSIILLVTKYEREAYQDGRVLAGTVDISIGLFEVFALDGGLWSQMSASSYQVYVDWCSSDLYYLSTLETIGGTLYLSASDPIPLDGMTVIEWDGVTDGLEQYGSLDGYRVADYIVPESCVAVCKWDGILYTSSDFSSGTGGWGCMPPNIIGGIAVFGLAQPDDSGSSGVYFAQSDSSGYTQLFAYTPATEEEATTNKDFWNGVACGLCGSGTPNLSDTSPFGVGYITGCKLRALRERKPIAYLYNGVKLPKLPATTEDAPNGFIVVSSANGETVYYARYASSKKKVNVDGAVILLQYDYVLQNGTWVSGTNTVAGTLMWANYDVYYSDGVEAVGGTLYLAASDPVPVYE